MALTIEDGTIVAGADSYVTRDELCTYAINRNVVIEDDENADEWLRKAFDYIDSNENKLSGTRRYDVNASSYPRNDLEIDGYLYDNSTIPEAVKNCQMELAMDLKAGVDLYNRKASDSTPIKSKMVGGAIALHYAIGNASPVLQKSRSRYLLSKLKRSSGGLAVGVGLG